MSDEIKNEIEILASTSERVRNNERVDITPAKLENPEDCRLELLRIQVKLQQEELDGKKQDREDRKTFAKYLFWLLVGYLIIVFTILILASSDCVGMTVSDSVLITMLATTTANIIGLFAIVARYLFRHNEIKGDTKQEERRV